MGELVRFYLFTISIRGYHFNKVNGIVNQRYLSAFSLILCPEL